MTTVEEITMEATACADKLIATLSRRQRWHMTADDLRVLLMDAYAQGIKSGVTRSVREFAPSKMDEFKRLCS